MADEELDDILNDAALFREERDWHRAVTQAGSRVQLPDGGEGRVVRGAVDPVNGRGTDRMVLVAHVYDGGPVERWYKALSLSPLRPNAKVIPLRRKEGVAGFVDDSWIELRPIRSEKAWRAAQAGDIEALQRAVSDALRKRGEPALAARVALAEEFQVCREGEELSVKARVGKANLGGSTDWHAIGYDDGMRGHENGGSPEDVEGVSAKDARRTAEEWWADVEGERIAELKGEGCSKAEVESYRRGWLDGTADWIRSMIEEREGASLDGLGSTESEWRRLSNLTDEDHRSFVWQLNQASQRLDGDAKFGNDRWFIAPFWHAFNWDMSRDEWNARLVRAMQAGFVSLHRADLVEVMDPKTVADSEIRYQGGTWHFIGTERRRYDGFGATRARKR